YQHGTAWMVFGSMLNELALVFALPRTESDELEAHPGASCDLHLAPADQHLKPRTHLQPNFHRFFISHEEAANPRMVLHIPSGCSTNSSPLPGCGVSACHRLDGVWK